jgi:hypothetical protein
MRPRSFISGNKCFQIFGTVWPYSWRDEAVLIKRWGWSHKILKHTLSSLLREENSAQWFPTLQEYSQEIIMFWTLLVGGLANFSGLCQGRGDPLDSNARAGATGQAQGQAHAWHQVQKNIKTGRKCKKKFWLLKSSSYNFLLRLLCEWRNLSEMPEMCCNHTLLCWTFYNLQVLQLLQRPNSCT